MMTSEPIPDRPSRGQLRAFMLVGCLVIPFSARAQILSDGMATTTFDIRIANGDSPTFGDPRATKNEPLARHARRALVAAPSPFVPRAVEGCEIDAEPLVIGSNVGVANTGPDAKRALLNATAMITLHCSPGTIYEISIGHGRHYDGGRRMRSDTTASYAEYEFFLDPDHQVRWDEDRPLRGVAGAEGSSPVTVFALVRGKSLSGNAEYADVIDVRVEYY
jgi:spore coat protein U-like protein